VTKWPEKYSPDRTAVHAHNEIEAPVSPERVWSWLVRADLWPTWYSNAKNVVIEGGSHELGYDTVFRWTTFGVRLRSRVEEFNPPERLGWSARGLGVDVYHAWLIEARPGGCRIVTEENQNGFAARISSLLRPGNMEKYHQVWLANLVAKAERGSPPAP
jgi:uncharacterized protein YndB with AHSA1/START domain